MKKTMLLLVALLFAGAQMLSAQRTITGTVISADDNMGVPGATVTVRGTTTGTTTDINGRFSLNVPTGATHLVFAFMGMETQEVEIGGRTTIDVTMTSGIEMLEGVIITGFGNIRRSTFTGSADVIDSEIIERSQFPNVTRALEGVMPGVQVTNNTGQPGADMNVRIRGIGSVNASNAPLWVVDGVPFSGDIASINPADIENISVLRDATAAALYGARGANGVILVTTRRGRTEQTQINFQTTQGLVFRGLPEFDLVSPAEYMEAMWLRLRNTAVSGGMDPALAGQAASNDLISTLHGYNPFNMSGAELIDPLTGKINPNAQLLWNDCWVDALTRMGHRQEYQFSVSRGNIDNNLFISASYLNERGLVPSAGFERFTGRINTQNRLNNWARLDMSLAATRQTRNNVTGDGATVITNPFSFSRNMPAIYPIWQRNPATGDFLLDENGDRIFDWGNTVGNNTMQPGTTGVRRINPGSNLVASLPLDYNGGTTNQINARMGLDIEIIEGLTYRIAGSSDWRSIATTIWRNQRYGEFAERGGILTLRHETTFSWNLMNTLTYTRRFGEHGLTAMVGHQAYAWNYTRLDAERQGFPFGTHHLGTGSIINDATSWEHNYRQEGFFISANYDFMDRYHLSASYRRDGSSRFNQDYRWGNFWSFGASWMLSREDFMRSISWLDILTLRASYGAQGNDGLLNALGTAHNYYPWQSLFEMGNWSNAGNPGALHSSLEARSLRWESQRMFNTGVDFRMFRRFSGTVEYYIRNNSDMLFNRPLPASGGLTSIAANVGAMRSWGVEVALSYDIIQRPDFRWTIGANATHWRDEIVRLAPENEDGMMAPGSALRRLEIGHSFYDFFMRDFAGVNEFGQALHYTDATRTATTTVLAEAEPFFLGRRSVPDLYGGFSTTVQWKGFDFSLMFSYGIGGYVYDGLYANLMHQGSAFWHNWHRDILNSWTPENTNTNIPALNAHASHTDAMQGNPSSRWLTSASFLNFRNITLGYTFPSELTNRIGIQSSRFFVVADNIFISTARRGMDPQQALTGVQNPQFFPVRSVTFGLSVQF